MSLTVGNRLPDASFLMMGPAGPTAVELGPKLKGRKVVIFAVPGAFTGIGMNFTAPPAGLIDRSARYAMLVDDGVVTVLHREESPGTCEASAGEGLLAAI